MAYQPMNAQVPNYGATQPSYPTDGPPEYPSSAAAPPYAAPGQYPQQPYQQPAAAVVPNYYGTQGVQYVVESAPTVVYPPSIDNYTGQIALACFVTWCCSPLFGLIAFVLAVMADGRKFTNQSEAYRLGRASTWVSISGIICSVVITVIILGVVYGTDDHVCLSGYYIDGICYGHRQGPCPYENNCCATFQHYFMRYCYYN